MTILGMCISTIECLIGVSGVTRRRPSGRLSIYYFCILNYILDSYDCYSSNSFSYNNLIRLQNNFEYSVTEFLKTIILN